MQKAPPAIDPFNAQAMAAASKQASEYFDAARHGQFARAVVTNDIMATNTELADLASACNRRLAQRLAA